MFGPGSIRTTETSNPVTQVVLNLFSCTEYFTSIVHQKGVIRFLRTFPVGSVKVSVCVRKGLYPYEQNKIFEKSLISNVQGSVDMTMDRPVGPLRRLVFYVVNGHRRKGLKSHSCRLVTDLP